MYPNPNRKPTFKELTLALGDIPQELWSPLNLKTPIENFQFSTLKDLMTYVLQKKKLADWEQKRRGIIAVQKEYGIPLQPNMSKSRLSMFVNLKKRLRAIETAAAKTWNSED